MESTRYAFVGAGSNLGDRLEHLKGAFTALRRLPTTEQIHSSSVYETVPHGVINQPLYLNAVVSLRTSESPEALLRELLQVEQQFGRIRHERWSARTLDLDLLVYEGESRASDSLQLPHPRMFERSFVITPFRELLESATFREPRWQPLLDQLLASEPDENSCRLAYPPLC